MCHSKWNPLISPTWTEELASSCTDSGPKVGRELLLVLVLQNELCDGSLPQRAGSSHGSYAAFLLHQLAVNQGHQLSLHGTTQYALCRAAEAHTWRDVRHRRVVKKKSGLVKDFAPHSQRQFLHFPNTSGVAERFKVESQLFHTLPGLLIML